MPILMERDLREPLEPAVWPAGARLEEFTTRHARSVHELLSAAYRSGGGSVPGFRNWWSSLSRDIEFDPQLVFLATDEAARVIGVAQCWTSAFVKDLAVHPGWRRRGLGRALLLHTFDVFKQRGTVTVRLKVEPSNPSGAIRLYRAVGMRQKREPT